MCEPSMLHGLFRACPDDDDDDDSCHWASGGRRRSPTKTVAGGSPLCKVASPTLSRSSLACKEMGEYLVS